MKWLACQLTGHLIIKERVVIQGFEYALKLITWKYEYVLCPVICSAQYMFNAYCNTLHVV